MLSESSHNRGNLKPPFPLPGSDIYLSATFAYAEYGGAAMRAFTLHNVISYDAETACHTLQPTTAGGPITLDLYAQDEEWLVQAGWDSVLVPLEIVLGSHEMAFGFKMAALTSKTADAYFLEVTTVHADAAAARSGLKGRDKIISVNGVTGTAKQMQRELQGKHKLELLVVRGGEVSEGGESSIGGGGGGGYEGGDDDGGGGGDDNDGGGGGDDGHGRRRRRRRRRRRQRRHRCYER